MARWRRPASVTWLALAVFVLAMANLFGAASGITRRALFATLDLALPLWAIVATAGAWGIAWLALGWGLWRLRPAARPATMLAFALYALMEFCQQALFAQGGYERGRLPFVAAMSVLAAGVAIFVLTRPGVRRAFNETGPNKEPDER